MENQQLQQPAIDTRVSVKKGKKREFKNRKTFSLKAMESLVDKVSFLKTKYDSLAINAQEKLGYHYNEILNILLFHKYVKGNKKLFEMYKKIKDAINKGYDFDKNKKLKENTMKKATSKNKNTHFAINKNTNKILESWNYEGYDQDELKKYKNEYFTKDLNRNHPFLNENDIVVVTAKNLSKRQLNESNKKDWQKYNYSHFALLKETNHILYGYDYSNVDKEDLKVNKQEYFLKVLSEVYGSDLSPNDVVVVKSNKLSKLGVKDYLNETNWVGLINEAYCGSKMDEELLNEGPMPMDGKEIMSYVKYNLPFDIFSKDDMFSMENPIARINSEDEMEVFIDDFEETYNTEPVFIFFPPSKRSVILTNMENGKVKKGSWKSYLEGNYGAKPMSNDETIDESSDVGSVFGAEGMPVANPYMRPKKGFDLSYGQDMYKAKNMLPSVKKGIKKYQSEFSNPTFKQTTEPEFITPVKTTHYSGTKKKAMKEGYDLVDLDALMDDDIVEYKKLSSPSNVFKSPKVELIRENNRDGIIEFLLKYQGHELPEFYNKRQLNTLSLKTLNEYYSRLVQRLGLLEEEKKHDALVRIDALKSQSQKDSNSYYKKDASNKTTTMLVQKGEGDGLVYDKDSRQRKDIPKYDYQSEHQREYLEKIHRGLEDVVPEKNPDGEANARWEARKEALMSTQEVGAKAYKAAEKRIKYKDDHKLGTNKAVLLQKDLPKVKKSDKALKENNSFNLVNGNDILNQIQSYYIDDENRKKPVIFDANNVIEVLNEKKLVDCKELNYKGLGQTLSEEFKNKVLNKKLLYSPSSKKVYLV
jgi:hypothetical protein